MILINSNKETKTPCPLVYKLNRPIDIKILREAFKVLWGYLKHCKNYKLACDKAEKTTDNDELCSPEFIKYCFLSPLHNLDFINIISTNFDEWWDEYENNLFCDNNPLFPEIFPEMLPEFPTIDDHMTRIDWHIDRTLMSFMGKYARVPDLDEFISFYKSYLKSLPWSILEIDQRYPITKTQKLLKDFFLKNKKSNGSQYKDKEFDNRHTNKIIRLPDNMVEVIRLKKYLMVYELRSETPRKKWEEVIRLVSAKFKEDKYNDNMKSKDSDPDIIRRIFSRYYKKATKILNNLDNGIFPGKYS